MTTSSQTLTKSPTSQTVRRKTKSNTLAARIHDTPLTLPKQASLLRSLKAGYSVNSWCAKHRINIAKVYCTAQTDEDFAKHYTHARVEAGHSHADHVARLTEAVEAGKLDPQAARAAMDGRKWLASKLAREVYGDKVEVVTESKENLADYALAHARTVLAKEAINADESQ